MNCSRCSRSASVDDLIVCSGCRDGFDFKCAGFNEANFRNMLKMNKLKWKCAKCKSTTVSPKGTSGGEQVQPSTLDEVLRVLSSLKQNDDISLLALEILSSQQG
jgi:DNA-directed RNA polymerase subunit RPC12/RpoP